MSVKDGCMRSHYINGIACIKITVDIHNCYPCVKQTSVGEATINKIV